MIIVDAPRVSWKILITALLTMACAPRAQETPMTSGWRSLFDGTSTSQWRAYRGDSVPPAWKIVDGALTKTAITDDLVTREQFDNFELTFEWKLPPGGNSGVFYRGTEEYEYIFWSAPEYQLLDDSLAPDGKSRLTAAGSNFAVYPAPAGIVKPANQWNTARIIVNGAHVEHWLNGVKLLEYELWSPDWVARVKASKFKSWPHFGLAKRGYIGIQGNHEGAITLRNIRIRPLP